MQITDFMQKTKAPEPDMPYKEEAATSTPKELNYNNIKIADIIIMYTLYQIGEPTHGYTLAQLCNMKKGALYPILYRLSDRGIIKGTEERVQMSTNRHRTRVNYEPVVPEDEIYANTKDIIHAKFSKIKFCGIKNRRMKLPNCCRGAHCAPLRSALLHKIAVLVL